jgi:hypothetical protein
MRKYRGVFIALILAAAAALQGAAPDQVGDYSGTLKTKIRTSSGQSSVKSTMLLSIAADDSTTVTIDGVVQLSSTALFGPSAALFTFADPAVGTSNNGTFATGYFKNSVFKGTATVVTIDSGLGVVLSTGSGKFKLKKLP